MESKKILLTFLIVTLCLSSAFAAWYFIINGTMKINIASIGSYKEATLNFNDLNLNTTTSSAYANNSMTFVYNRAGNFTVAIIETISDLSNGECQDAAHDCETNYQLFDGNSYYKIVDKQSILIPMNTNLKKIAMNMTCIAYSCPQNRDISVKLTQVA